MKQQIKAQGEAFLDFVIACDDRRHLYILVRECFSSCIIATGRISKSDIREQLRYLFYEIMEQLPVPVHHICYPDHEVLRQVVSQMSPTTVHTIVAANGVAGMRDRPLRRRRTSS